MDSESKKLLEDTFELAQENNDMLHSMRRSQRISSIMSIIYWVLIIGSALGAYYYLQPYVDQFRSIVDTANGVIKDIKSVGLPK